MKENRIFYKTVRFLLNYFVRLFFPFEIRNIENLKMLNKQYILCSNHLSNIDPLFLIVSNNKTIRFMAKSELFKNKLLGYIFSSMGAFSVKRGKGDKKALLTAENILKNDEVLGIFIEGTRSKTGEFLRPKSGAVLLACKTGVPIIPVCITGSGNDNKVKIFKKTVISYGKPINLSENFDVECISTGMLREMSNVVMDSIRRMR